MPEPATVAMLSTGVIGLAVRYLRRKYMQAKPILEWGLALIMLVAFSPLLLLCALAIKLTSRGPAFYRQERVGRHGRRFILYKLRTMRQDAEALTGPVWAQGDNDSRLTPIGGFLRRTHLDEVPQLINVLRGEMSLVGPRPERPCFVERLKEQVPGYEQRLAVRPGITGLAQIRAGYDQTIEDVRRKLRFDVMYIRRMCWWVDFSILWSTFVKLLRSVRGGERRAHSLAAH